MDLDLRADGGGVGGGGGGGGGVDGGGGAQAFLDPQLFLEWAVEAIADMSAPPTATEAAELLDCLREMPEFSVITVGYSTAGIPIEMVVFGAGDYTALFYSYPHPDEPMGAMACAGLLQAARRAGPLLTEANLRLGVILYPDPDITELNERWIRGGGIEDFVYGSFRPEYTARQIDYGFPIDWGPFYQDLDYDGARACWYAGRCVQPDRCGQRCGRELMPPGPLAESLAIAEAIEFLAPDLVCSLHSSHSGGSYSFLLHAPSIDLHNRLILAAEECELPRHLGILPDRAEPWGAPDLVREPDLASAVQRLRERGGDPEQNVYAGNVSCAQYLQSRFPKSEFLVPEAGEFTHPDFGDIDAAEDGASVGAHLAQIYELRRFLYRAADDLWKDFLERYAAPPEDPYAAERMARGDLWAGDMSPDSLARIILPPQSGGDLNRVATRAERADLLWRIPTDDLRLVGTQLQWLEDQGYTPNVVHDLRNRITREMERLPELLQSATGRRRGAVSQLRRAFIVIEARRGPIAGR